MHNVDPMQSLIAAMRAKAKNLGLTSVESPPELTNAQLPGNALLAGVTNSVSPVAPQETEPSVPAPIGMFLGRWSALFGSLASETIPSPSSEALRDNIVDRWRHYQRRAAVARAAMDEKRQDDLTLFLVGPAGSNKDEEWKALASQMERNDLVCRKLVWLPPLAPREYNAALSAFLRRTFLARPWQKDTIASQQPLDAITTVGATLTRWQELLDQQPYNEDEIDYDLLATQLINTYQP